MEKNKEKLSIKEEIEQMEDVNSDNKGRLILIGVGLAAIVLGACFLSARNVRTNWEKVRQVEQQLQTMQQDTVSGSAVTAPVVSISGIDGEDK